MKHAINRGQSIAYEVFGNGRTAVILQHGFLRNRHVWSQFGYVDALAQDFTVIAVDSLGHGDSSKPHDPACYARAERTGDITAVLDAENIERAHYAGYSMGGWLGIGMVAHKSQRLLSATIGGFDPYPEAALMPGLDIDRFLAMARAAVPETVAWVTDDVKPALAACFAEIQKKELPVSALTESKVPLHLWTGSEDSTFAPLKRLHTEIPDSSLSIVSGDHPGAMANKDSVTALRKFLLL